MNKTIKILSYIGKISGAVASVASYADALPPKWQGLGLLIIGISSILKDTVNRLGDLLDDGKSNDSFKP